MRAHCKTPCNPPVFPGERSNTPPFPTSNSGLMPLVRGFRKMFSCSLNLPPPQEVVTDRSSQANPRIPHSSPNTPICSSTSKPLLEFFFTQKSTFWIKNLPRLKDLCQMLPLSQELLPIIFNPCINGTLT